MKSSQMLFVFQREFGRKAGAEELQSAAWRPDAAVLWALPGELLRPLRYLSGVCWGKASGPACSHRV